MMPQTRQRPIALTPRGRVRATLATLEARWDSLTVAQQARALELVGELYAAVRAARLVRAS